MQASSARARSIYCFECLCGKELTSETRPGGAAERGVLTEGTVSSSHKAQTTRVDLVFRSA
jgi:hypothetical protein